MKTTILMLVAIAGGALSQEDFACPDEFEGYYPHLTSCDKYWYCDQGIADLKLCGNGLAFVDTDPSYNLEQCAELHLVECGDRFDLEPAISTRNCPYLHGTFADEEDCGVFWKCIDGKSNRYECPPGLAFDQVDHGCRWADQVPECTQSKVVISEEGEEFQCPSSFAAGTFTKHAHPADCRQYFLCIGGVPREYGCPLGQVFSLGEDDFSGKCTDPEEVLECKDYYGDLEFDNSALSRNGADIGSTGDSFVERPRSGISRNRGQSPNSISRPASPVKSRPASVSRPAPVRQDSRPTPPELQSILDKVTGNTGGTPFNPTRTRGNRPAPQIPSRPVAAPAPPQFTQKAAPSPPQQSRNRPQFTPNIPSRLEVQPIPQKPAPVPSRPAPTIPSRLEPISIRTTPAPQRTEAPIRTTLSQRRPTFAPVQTTLQEEPQTTIAPRFTATSRPRFGSTASRPAFGSTNRQPAPTSRQPAPTTTAPAALDVDAVDTEGGALPPPVKAQPGPNGEEYYYYYYYYDDEEEGGPQGAAQDST